MTGVGECPAPSLLWVSSDHHQAYARSRAAIVVYNGSRRLCSSRCPICAYRLQQFVRGCELWGLRCMLSRHWHVHVSTRLRVRSMHTCAYMMMQPILGSTGMSFVCNEGGELMRCACGTLCSCAPSQVLGYQLRDPPSCLGAVRVGSLELVLHQLRWWHSLTSTDLPPSRPHLPSPYHWKW